MYKSETIACRAIFS